MPQLRALPDKLRRLGRSLHEAQAAPDDLWALARLTPAEGRVYLRMDARDREHAVRVAQALMTQPPMTQPPMPQPLTAKALATGAQPGQATAQVSQDMGHSPSGELVAAALLHDCGKLVYRYRVWERVGAGLLPYRLAGRLAWMPARVRACHPAWGAALLRAAGGRERVSALVAAHHQPGSDPEAALLHRLDDLE